MTTEEVQKTAREQRRDARQEQNRAKHPHVVDQLILERAEKLSRSKLWWLYRLSLNKILDYRTAVRMVNEAGDYRARDAMDYISEKLNLTIDLTGIENIPERGACVVCINHPTGIADGVAVYDALIRRRPDLCFFANADALRLNPHLGQVLIPVEWNDRKKTRAKSRETLKATTAAFEEERCVVLFPSGRLAYMDEDRQLTEQPWMPTVAALPKRYECPLIPAHLTSRNSWLYYWFWNVNTELRDMTLFHELLNKEGQTFRLAIGDAIDPETLPEDNDLAARMLREFVTGPFRDGQDWPAYLATSPAPPVFRGRTVR